MRCTTTLPALMSLVVLPSFQVTIKYIFPNGNFAVLAGSPMEGQRNPVHQGSVIMDLSPS
jgi:hypothetical protein